MKRMCSRGVFSFSIFAAILFAAPHADAAEQLAPGGAFRMPAAGTVATYQCTGGKAKTVEYAIEAVDGNTLTVKVTGDGEDFGTYRRKAWQMVGTTLYEELRHKGKASKGDSNFTQLAGVARLQPFQKFTSKSIMTTFSSVAEPPISWDDMEQRAGTAYTFGVLPITLELSTGDRSEQMTKAFGRQVVVPIEETRKVLAHGTSAALLDWNTHLKTAFAPGLGFPIRQEYRDSSRYGATCELTAIAEPGAVPIAAAPPAPTPAVTQQAVAPLRLAPGGAFRIPPAGTKATYQCTGSKARSIEYAIEAVEGDTLTVKVSGDGADFGTYRRKAWQTVGTTQYEELIYRGKTFRGARGSAALTQIGSLVPLGTLKERLVFRQFMSVGEPPVEPGEIALRSGYESQYSDFRGHRFDVVLQVLEQREEDTKAFGRQALVSVAEKRGGKVGNYDPASWQSILKTEFAPALGFPLRQKYQDGGGNLRVSCELASIDGPGAAYIAMAAR